jgi:hypothetical protein
MREGGKLNKKSELIKYDVIEECLCGSLGGSNDVSPKYVDNYLFCIDFLKQTNTWIKMN